MLVNSTYNNILLFIKYNIKTTIYFIRSLSRGRFLHILRKFFIKYQFIVEISFSVIHINFSLSLHQQIPDIIYTYYIHTYVYIKLPTQIVYNGDEWGTKVVRYLISLCVIFQKGRAFNTIRRYLYIFHTF